MVVKPQIDLYDQYIPYPEYLKLLLRATDGTTSGIKDFSGYGRVVTNSTGATGSTTQRKINPYSMYFDGTDDVISVPDSTDWVFGDSDWTFSVWFSPTSLRSNDTFFEQNATSSSFIKAGLGVVSGSTTHPRFYALSSNTAVGEYTTTDAITLNTGTWYNLVYQREGSVFKIFVNGISYALTMTTQIATLPNCTTALYIGSDTLNTPRYITGYLDELMIWKGIAVPISQLYPQTKPFSFRRA